MNKLPEYIMIIIRIILLPIAFILHLIPHIFSLLFFMYAWVRYGGEFITYMKDDKPTIGKIYNQLKTKQNEQL